MTVSEQLMARQANVDGMATYAVYSPDEVYRYGLRWSWDDTLPEVVWIMLNPSTATETKLDPTVTRCVNWTRAWGAGSAIVLNLFAYRTPDPSVLVAAAAMLDPVGPENDRWIDETLEDVGEGARIMVGWGRGGRFRNRGAEVTQRLTAAGHTLEAFGMNKDGSPVHPGPRTTWLRPDSLPVVYREAL